LYLFSCLQLDEKVIQRFCCN